MESISPIEVYPHILRRYLATVIDAFFVLGVGFLLAELIRTDELGAARGIVFLIVLLLYEPVLTSRRCTLGQWVMRVRIRHEDTWDRISVPRAYLRIVVKMVLGMWSFFTIPFTSGRRGVHDFAAGSIVVSARSAASPDEILRPGPPPLEPPPVLS